MHGKQTDIISSTAPSLLLLSLFLLLLYNYLLLLDFPNILNDCLSGLFSHQVEQLLNSFIIMRTGQLQSISEPIRIIFNLLKTNILALVGLFLRVHKIDLVPHYNYPHISARVVPHLLDPMLHLLEGGQASDVVNSHDYLGVLVVYLGYRPISLLTSSVPYFEGDPISVFQLMHFFVIDRAQRWLNRVHVWTLEGVTVDDTGLTHARMAHDDYLKFLALHDMR